jgi:hypothetical protein
VTGHRFLVSCRHCQRPILLGDRIRDAELSQLRQHVLDRHPDKMASPSPGIEALLRHFRVEPEPAPPDSSTPH